MAHNRTTQYSAPFKRNTLMGLQQYAASEGFPSLGRWDKARNEDLYVVKSTVGRNHPVNITVVGVITSDKAHLQPHGNYEPHYTPIDLIGKKAKLQFVIAPPSDDPDFCADYATALERLKAIQEEVAASPSRRDHFIEGENLKMNFFLFSEKEIDVDEPKKTVDDSGIESDTQEEGELAEESDVEPYDVGSPYRHAWDTVSQTYHNNILPVWNTDETLVDYRSFPKVLLPGTTVAVEFTLKHFAIRERGTPNVASDTYVSSLVSVSILKAAEKKIRQAPGTTPKRRPLTVSQTPTRDTLKLAADTFSPIRTRTEPSSSRNGGRTREVSPPTPTPSTVRSSPYTVNRQGELPFAITEEMIDLLLPHLMERIKQSSAAARFQTPDRDRSSSPTLSTSSGASKADSLGSKNARTASPFTSAVVPSRDDTARDDTMITEPELGASSSADGGNPVDGSSETGQVGGNEPTAVNEEPFEMIDVTEPTQLDSAENNNDTTRIATPRNKASSYLSEKREGKRRRA